MTSPPPKIDGAVLLDRFRSYMRDHNLPVTEQRESIASAIFFSDGHLSVDDVDQSLRREDTHVGRATIYRTLELMNRAGLIDEHDFGEGFKRYEPRASAGHHEHLICRECGHVVEFSSDRIERMNMLIAEEYGFRLHQHRLEIYGTCASCQQHDAETLGGQKSRQRVEE